MMTIVAIIEDRLRLALMPTLLIINDESAQHRGHVGARDGGGHYRVRIVSERFSGLSRLARHRMVYDALAELMQRDIHALAIEALTSVETAAEAAPE